MLHRAIKVSWMLYHCLFLFLLSQVLHMRQPKKKTAWAQANTKGHSRNVMDEFIVMIMS